MEGAVYVLRHTEYKSGGQKTQFYHNLNSMRVPRSKMETGICLSFFVGKIRFRALGLVIKKDGNKLGFGREKNGWEMGFRQKFRAKK